MTGLYFIGALVLGLLVTACRNRRQVFSVSLVFLALQTVFSIYGVINQGITEWGYFSFDAAGLLFLVVLTLLAWATFYHGLLYLEGAHFRKLKYYHAALIGLISSMTGAYLANDLTAMWVFVEATTLTVAALIYHERTATALEATWKYIFVCSVGIAVAYFGILFLGASGKPGLSFDLSFKNLPDILGQSDPVYLRIAFLCILVGYSTKMGLFPMHTVAIDAHTVAPPPISALISTALMNVGFLAIFRGFEALASTPILEWMRHVLLLAGTLSLLVSAAYMQKVSHLKRLFAYSSLENMGIVAIGLGIGGVGTYAAFLHILLHSLVKASLFYQAGNVYKIYHSYDLSRISGYFALNPAGAGLLLAAAIGISAIPPSGMFVSEFFIFRELIASGNWLVLGSSFLLLCYVIFAFFSRMLKLLYSTPEAQTPSDRSGHRVSGPAVLLILILFGLCFYRFPWLDRLISEAITRIPA